MLFSISGAVDVVRWRASWNALVFPETVSSPEDGTIIVASPLECSSPKNCGSASEFESELSRSRIWSGIWWFLVGGTMLTALVA